MAGPLIETRGLAKDYRVGPHVVHALRDVSVTIQAGELVAVMGPSGSGKSTFLNLVGCLDRPTDGAYLLDGRDVSHLSWDEQADVRNRKVGFVFQTFNLLPRTSALENVELPLVYTGVPAAARRRRTAEALRRVGLGDRLAHHPSQLSGGEQQRVAIARALVGEPRVILADEPTGNLDSRASAEVMALLRGLSDGGLTVVLVTHEADIAANASRLLRMRDGRVESDERRGAPACARPAGEIVEARP